MHEGLGGYASRTNMAGAPLVAQQATRTIPIVAMSDDILGAGLIASLSRPGGNTTGLTILSPELSVKRLELLKEVLAGATTTATCVRAVPVGQCPSMNCSRA